MKNLLQVLLLFCALALGFAGCEDDAAYDDSLIREEIERIKGRLEALNGEVASLKTLVSAFQQGKVILDVKESEDGYLVSFSDGTSIVLVNGKNGQPGEKGNDAPQIGIDLYDGVYYWTIGGREQWLTDAEGNKLPVSGREGHTPQLGVDAEGFWTVDGERVQDPGGHDVAAGSIFVSVEKGENEVTFVLADGSSLVLPLKTPTFLRFTQDFYALKTGRPNRLNLEFSDDLKDIKAVNVPEGYRVNLHLPNRQVNVDVEDGAFGLAEICVQAVDRNGFVYMAIAKVGVAGKGLSDPNGVYILNEGNMTTENGSLIYITPEGKVYENLYAAANGKMLGNVCQDMYIYADKMYIISQNGEINAMGVPFENDGMMVIADSRTMKRIASFHLEDFSLFDYGSWPTHVAVLDEEHVYLRYNGGVAVFNGKTKEMQLIEGTQGAKKHPMIVAAGKVFVETSGRLLVLEKGQNQVAKSIEIPSVSGMAKAPDGNLYVSTSKTSDKPSSLMKINAQTYETLRTNTVNEFNFSSSTAASAVFSVKGDAGGDKIYFSGTGTKIWRHNFATGESKMMVDVSQAVPGYTVTYNTVAVHPVTGRVYINRLKAFGFDYLVNKICVFEDTGEALTLEKTYDNYTRFPAGIFFPTQF